MIGRSLKRGEPTEEVESKGFDAFELRLGDIMRGERATMGKSLLDVQRELKIKAAYVAAIENSDPTAFDTPGFIAGYVRSYARYLGMDPDWAFETFCRESGFATAHGMSKEASSVKPAKDRIKPMARGSDMFAAPNTPFIPSGETVMARIEPGAIGSVAVLIALIGGLGYGGWTMLQQVQKVQFAPVEQTPTVVSDLNLDPLAGAANPTTGDETTTEEVAAFTAPSVEALDRLYRPQALDVPVMVARDAPISTLDPSAVGALAPVSVEGETMMAGLEPDAFGVDAVIQDLMGGPSSVKVTEDPLPGVQLVAVRPAWVRVRAADGSVIYETIMNAGDTFDVPQTEEAATLRVGESGALYFRVNGTHYGPVGPRGEVTSNVALSVDSLTASYQMADLTQDTDLAQVINVAEVQATE